MDNKKCIDCGIVFVKRSGLIAHIKRKHSNNIQNVAIDSNDNYPCEECDKQFINERNYTAHKRTHAILGKLNCPICDFKNCTRKQLVSHFKNEHDILVEEEEIEFNNIQDFFVWKTQTEKENHCTFVKNRSAYTNREFKKTDYYCHRSGNYRNTGTLQRHIKTQGSCKINGLCPASIKVHEYNNGNCRVTYTKTHVGHELDLGHTNLTSDERKNIAVKISLKVPFTEILNEIRDTVTNCKLERMHLLTRKDLYNIENSFKLNSLAVRHKNDSLSVDAWVKEMEKNNCVLFYKPQNVTNEEYSFLKDEDFMLAIMTQGQKEMLLKYASDCICIDATHGVNSYGFELHTVLILDDMREGFPCAFLISNRGDEEIMVTFFNLIYKEVQQKIKPKVFMSDLAPVYYNAWQRVMYSASFRLFCTWHVDRAWRKNLNKISTKEKQISTYKALRTLLQETDKNAFEKMLPKFIDILFSDPDTAEYGKYFSNHYVNQKECWAYCYRLNCGINTNMHVERMHRTIKYLYLHGKHVKRLDQAIHGIMNFVRDKLFDRLITINKGKLCSKLRQLRLRHAESEKLSLDMVLPEEASWQVMSASSSQMYLVQEVVKECQCKLSCSDCQNVCLHQYSCSCLDASIKWNMCKHIHLVCRFLRYSMATKTSEQEMASESECENNLVIQIKPTAEEETKIIEAVSQEQVKPNLGKTEIENFILNFSTFIRSNVTTNEELQLVKKLIAPVEPTLTALKQQKNQNVVMDKKENSISTNKKITPQRRMLFSTRKKKKCLKGKLSSEDFNNSSIAINLLQ